MIVTVTANPALDLTWHVESIVPGGTHRADAGRARAGGKGLNVARVAHAQGAPVCAVTTTGGATGAEFAAELGSSGVPHVLVPVAAATRRSVALVDEALGDTTIVNERGVAPTASEWQALQDAVADALRGATVLVISGSLPLGSPADVLPALIARGRQAGATVIADTSGPALLAAADAGATVLKPNEHELAEATGLADPIEGARELLRRGAGLVLLSRGAEGMLAVTRAEPDSVDDGGAAPGLAGSGSGPGRSASDGAAAAGNSRLPVSIVHARLDAPLSGNPTGAGDAAVAACAVLMHAGIRDPEQILRRATAWSAAAVLMPLAGDIHDSWPDLERALTVTHPAPSSRAPHPAETSLAARDGDSGALSHAGGQVSGGSAPAGDSAPAGNSAPAPASTPAPTKESA